MCSLRTLSQHRPGVPGRELPQPCARRLPGALRAGACELSVQPVAGPAERRSQLLCASDSNSQRQGVLEGCQELPERSEEGEAGGREEGSAEGGCNGMAGCPGFMGHKDRRRLGQ